jgi:hypothetical protein
VAALRELPGGLAPGEAAAHHLYDVGGADAGVYDVGHQTATAASASGCAGASHSFWQRRHFR